MKKASGHGNANIEVMMDQKGCEYGTLNGKPAAIWNLTLKIDQLQAWKFTTQQKIARKLTNLSDD